MGGVRRASLLLLVPWLAVCTAQGTICSNEPTVCLGTYTGIDNFRDHLDLEGKGLTGSLPTQLGLLTALTKLRLYDNKLSGSLPTQLGALTALTHMYLTYTNSNTNSLSGSLPTQLGALTALTSMYLQDNSFSGTIPQELPTPSTCMISTTSSYQCPLPNPSTTCTSGISCMFSPPPPSLPPSLPPPPSPPPPPPPSPPPPPPLPLPPPSQSSPPDAAVIGGSVAAATLPLIVGLVFLFLYLRKKAVSPAP